MRTFLIITIMVSAVACATAAYPYYTVTLKNGEELQAEEYRFEGDKISLKLKAGTASFPRMLVEAITGTGPQGDAGLPPAPAPPKTPPQTPDVTPQGREPVQPPAPPTATPPPGGEAPAAEENQGLLDDEGEDDLLPEDEEWDDEGLDDEIMDDEGVILDEGAQPQE